MKRFAIALILFSISAWLYRALFCPRRIEFHPADALENVDVLGHSIRWAE